MTGILTGHRFPSNGLWTGILLLFLIFQLLLLWMNDGPIWVKYKSWLIAPALFISGMFYQQITSPGKQTISSKKDIYTAEICQQPEKKTNSWQTVLLVKNKTMRKSVKVVAFFQKQTFDSTLRAGDLLIIQASLKEIEAKKNPYDFDYQAMMNKKGIYHYFYLSSGNYERKNQHTDRLKYKALFIQDQLTQLLRQSIPGIRECAVVSALTLGYRSELDPETTDYFADTGTIHVLSVSGLHVVLIFYMLNLLFYPFNHGKSSVYLYPVLMILGLWCYAFLTGFSPSVQRSTVMFSFIILGKVMKRPVNIFNTLSASALLLILLDASVLFDIGFQLSYLAVFGIILLQPPLEKLIQIKNKSLQWAWKLFTVSIAAQLVTFPLSVYYFNQFPNLFWLSNFIAIPATTFIMWLTFLFLIFSQLSIFSNLLAHLIYSLTHQMLIVLKWMSFLPHAVIEGIVLTPFQTLMIYFIMISIVTYCFYKNKAWLMGAMIFFISYQASVLLDKVDGFNQQVVIVYPSKTPVIHCINGRESYVLKIDHVPFKDREIQTIRNICNHLRLHKPRFLNLKDQNYLGKPDLMVRGNDLYFITSKINVGDPASIHLDGVDVAKFKMINQHLFKQDTLFRGFHPTTSLSGKKQPVSLDFKLHNKQGMYININ